MQRRSVKILPRSKPQATSVTKQIAFADITNIKHCSLYKSVTKRKLEFGLESKLNSNPNSNRNSQNGVMGISLMDKEQLQKKLQQALVEKDHGKELRLKALNEKDVVQKQLLHKEIEIGNL